MGGRNRASAKGGSRATGRRRAARGVPLSGVAQGSIGRARLRVRHHERLPVKDLGLETIGGTRDQIALRLKRMVRGFPDQVVEDLHSNRAIATQILRSTEVIELYGYILDMLDPELKEIAKRYASRLILKLASQIANAGVKTGSLYRTRDEEASDEIEIDATVERIVDNRASRIEENVMFLARRPEQKACMVILDHSYSMKGVKICMAALTAAAIALHFKQDYGVVVFNTNARILKGINRYKPPIRMAEEILSLSAHGYTNMREALQRGIHEMEGYGKKIGVLLTDGDWTCGGDPLQVARLFDGLHVIGLQEPVSPEDTYQDQVSRGYYAARVGMIAREGRGQFSYIHSIEEAPLAISRCLSG